MVTAAICTAILLAAWTARRRIARSKFGRAMQRRNEARSLQRAIEREKEMDRLRHYM